MSFMQRSGVTLNSFLEFDENEVIDFSCQALRKIKLLVVAFPGQCVFHAKKWRDHELVLRCRRALCDFVLSSQVFPKGQVRSLSEQKTDLAPRNWEATWCTQNWEVVLCTGQFDLHYCKLLKSVRTVLG